MTTSTGRHPYDIIVGKHSEEHHDTVVFYLLRIPLLILFTPVYWFHVLQRFATVDTVTTADYFSVKKWLAPTLIKPLLSLLGLAQPLLSLLSLVKPL